MWLISRAYNKLPFSSEILSLSVPQVDWIVSMLAHDNPDNIQILRKGEQVFNEEQIKTLTYVDAYDTMRESAKDEFLKKMIPEKLRNELKAREGRRVA